MSQPIPKKIIQEYNLETEKPTYTLLVDGNSLLEVAFNGDPRLNSKGIHIGGIFQFLLQLKIILAKRDFDFVYVFWDGNSSGQLRFNIYPEYKANREGKKFKEDNINSEYYKNIDKFCKRVLEKRNKQVDPAKLERKEIFHRQRKILQEYLEELYIRQVMCDEIEGDDLVAYYCKKRKSNDRIYIISGDRDLTQLLDDNICIYIPVLKKFVTTQNHKEILGFCHKNVVLKKMICGDVSDNIKGVKGVGEKTLFEIMPEIKEREVKLYEVIDRCNKLIEERINLKKKPLASHTNIINGITEGLQDDKLYEINRKIIDLKEPLMSREAIESMDDMMYVPIDGDGRSMANLYRMILRDDITELIDKDRFSNFFSTFNKSINNEQTFYKKWMEENK